MAHTVVLLDTTLQYSPIGMFIKFQCETNVQFYSLGAKSSYKYSMEKLYLYQVFPGPILIRDITWRYRKTFPLTVYNVFEKTRD